MIFIVPISETKVVTSLAIYSAIINLMFDIYIKIKSKVLINSRGM